MRRRTFFEDFDRDVQRTVEAGSTLDSPVVVEGWDCVRSGSYIEGPVVVLAEVEFGPYAYIRRATVLRPNARVGNVVEARNSIWMANATVPHHLYVGDPVLGRDVNFDAGTKVANLL